MDSASVVQGRLVLGLLAALPVGFAWWLVHKDNSEALDLLDRGAQVEGTVLSKACQHHGQVTYEFKVGAKQYIGTGSSCLPKRCDDITVGEAVRVTYDAAQPNHSSCVGGKRERTRALGGYSTVMFLAALLGIGIWRITRNEHKTGA